MCAAVDKVSGIYFHKSWLGGPKVGRKGAKWAGENRFAVHPYPQPLYSSANDHHQLQLIVLMFWELFLVQRSGEGLPFNNAVQAELLPFIQWRHT